jgi:hypothetical protein
MQQKFMIRSHCHFTHYRAFPAIIHVDNITNWTSCHLKRREALIMCGTNMPRTTHYFYVRAFLLLSLLVKEQSYRKCTLRTQGTSGMCHLILKFSRLHVLHPLGPIVIAYLSITHTLIIFRCQHRARCFPCLPSRHLLSIFLLLESEVQRVRPVQLQSGQGRALTVLTYSLREVS